jgi:hypothetical protein
MVVGIGIHTQTGGSDNPGAMHNGYPGMGLDTKRFVDSELQGVGYPAVTARPLIVKGESPSGERLNNRLVSTFERSDG